MDETTRRMIVDLINYGIQDRVTLARIYGVTERTVRRRIDNMTRSGIVKLVVSPNPVALGYKTWARIFIKVLPGNLAQVTRKLVAHPSVASLILTLGVYDIVVSVFFRTFEELSNFVNLDLLSICGIQEVETILLVSLRKYNAFTWSAPVVPGDKGGFQPENRITESGSHELEDEERKVLEVLRAEGPLRPKALASRLGTGESTMRKRLKGMLRKGVYRTFVMLNPSLTDVMEYGTHANIGIKIQGCSPHQVIDAILKNPAVYLASVSLGRFNVFIGTRFYDLAMLNNEVVPKIWTGS
ncbi:MAG: Lrp/AsnC family transcriptional regulator [Dehalococcoidales bacterium]|nr:Lrp/AsnC family transcriptional regulator [Dehalococcoidales bacterium]